MWTRNRHLHRPVTFSAFLIAILLVAALGGAARYTTLEEARGVLAALKDALPPDLAAGADAAWAGWIERHDREIRARLDRGDDDTIVHWLLFGTSFTSRPKAVFDPSVADPEPFVQLVVARTRDLISALQSPGDDERRTMARGVLARRGYGLETEERRNQLEVHLLRDVARVGREQNGYAADLAEARKSGDATEEFAAASRVYRARGLSLDTSIMPAFAVERALADVRDRGLLTRGSVREVGVIGPGLDFADKTSGYDFYPVQTVQPFTLIDSLRRLDLADRTGAMRLTTLDLSPRVNEHLLEARRRAGQAEPYRFRVPLDFGVTWAPDLSSYWASSGDQIGEAAASSLPTGSAVRVRTVSVPPDIVLRIQQEDVNIVVERIPDRRFDLIVATNIFVYYDVLDQALASANVEAMLRPGGLLLSNNALIELPGSRLRSAGYTTVRYSDRPDDGDRVVWYRREQ